MIGGEWGGMGWARVRSGRESEAGYRLAEDREGADAGVA